MGQNTYANQNDARDGATTELGTLNLRGTSIEEYKFLGTLILQTDDSYSNAVKSRIRTTVAGGSDTFIDWRSSVMPQGGTSSTVTDHGALGGLSDPDHPASAILTDTTNFDGLLSAADTTVQAALDTLDDISLTSDNIVSGSASATITADGLDITDGTDTFSLNLSSGDLYISNLGVGDDVYITGNIAGPTQKTIFKGAPDGAAELYYAGTKVFETGDTGGCLFYRQAAFPQTAITSTSNSTAWNLATAQAAIHTMTENTTIAAPSNQVAGATYTLKVVQGAGPYTLAWNAVFDWGAADTPAEPAANGDIVIFTFYSDGSTMFGVESIRKEA